MSVLKYKDADGVWKPVLGDGGNANIDVTAEVGQTIIVKEIDENGKPTKWEAVEYQRKICDKGFVELLPTTTTFQFDDVDGCFVTEECNFAIEAGASYTVNWNGTLYTCVAGVLGDEAFVGNVGALDGTGDTGEPFLIGAAQGFLIAFPLDGSTELTLGIYGEVYEKIDKTYLPNDIVYGDAMSRTVFDLEGWVYEKTGVHDITDTTRQYDGSRLPTWINTEIPKELFVEMLERVGKSVLFIGRFDEFTAAGTDRTTFMQATFSHFDWGMSRYDTYQLDLRWSDTDGCVQRSCIIVHSINLV